MSEINSVQDLIEALEENPEWLMALRGLIITNDLAQLPAQVHERLDRLEQGAKLTSGQLQDLASAVGGLNGRVENVETGLETLNGRVENVETGLETLNGRVERVEGRLDGIDGRLDGIDGRLDGIDGRLDRMDGRFDRLEGRMDNMDRRFDRLDSRTGNIDGRAYEAHAGRVLPRLLYPELNVASPRSLYRYHDAHGEDELNRLNGETPEERRLSDADMLDLADTDLIFQGTADGEPVHLTVETSITGDRDDALRADRRRRLLQRITGERCLAVVVAAGLTPALDEAVEENPGRGPRISAQNFNQGQQPETTIEADVLLIYLQPRNSG